MNSILFIDDDEEILNGYKKIFTTQSSSMENLANLGKELLGEYNIQVDTENFQYNVLTANQGQEGIEVIERHLGTDSPVKLVVVDGYLPPGMNGTETIEQILKLDDKIEIIMITAYSEILSSYFQETNEEKRSVWFLKKPFDIPEIKQFTQFLVQKYNNEYGHMSQLEKNIITILKQCERLLNSSQITSFEAFLVSKIILQVSEYKKLLNSNFLNTESSQAS